MRRVAVFASGSGSNFKKLVEYSKTKDASYQVVLLVVDKKDAFAIKRAQELKVPVFIFHLNDYGNKTEYEKEILKQLKIYEVDFICLAGYMKIIGEILLDAYPKKIINIHPSLLPSFRGIDAIKQALSYGVKVTGVTIHFVDEGIDTGEIIAQETLNINNEMTEADLIEKIHEIEHQLYPQVLNQLMKEGEEND